MFSHEFYKIVHIIGIVTLMVALGGAACLMMAGATTSRRLLAALHGVGAFLILLGGFGMLARLGIIQGGAFPAWLWLKIGVWLILGAALIVAWRRPVLARPVLFSLPVLAGVATYMAVYKPF